MRLAKIICRGFRNLDCEISLASPLAVVLGENNSGKSNLIDAIRLLLPPLNGGRYRRWVSVDDFDHGGSGAPVTDTFELEAVFADLDAPAQARMVTCLSPSLGDGVARLRLKARLLPSGRVALEWFGGDSQHPDVEQWAREAATYTYLHPLRDAAADLRPGRDNRLVLFLAALAPQGHSDREDIQAKVKAANEDLRDVGAIQDAEREMQQRLSAMVGQLYAQRTDLAFSDPVFERIIANLRARVGDQLPLEMDQNGLGFNNLLYMAALLASITHRTDAALHVLLVEEPEAHLHPQLQDLLMRYLHSQASPGEQVVVTSHSPNFASSAGVERATILSKDPGTRKIVARSPQQFDLEPERLDHLARFLDVTKAALLFARGVILVEGVAEQLLVPAIAEQMGRPLAEYGVTVVNVGGLSFAPFADLFAAERLPYRCAIVSDGDAPDDSELEGGDEALSATARKLKERDLENVGVFLSRQTLEWDLIAEGNLAMGLKALAPIKPRVAATLEDELGEKTLEEQATAFLEKVANTKGPFAQSLAQLLAAGERLTIPSYLQQAVEWATGAGPSQ